MTDYLPQFIEFATQLDLQKLIVIQTIICLFAAIRSVPAYNLPLFFFGLYAYQHHDSAEPLQQFAAFTAFSILLDIVWCLLSSGIGFGEGLTIAVLLLKPVTIISAFQLLKYRGEPFSSFGGGMDWPGRSVYGAGSGIGGYQSLGDPIDDERDAEEVNIPRHHSLHRFGRNRSSQQSDSFVTSSSRSTSVKSSGTGSGYNVEMGTNNSNSGAGGHQMQHQHQHQHQQHHGGSPASAGGTAVSLGSATAKDDRRDRVGQNVSDDESEDTSSREAPGNPATESRAGYQAF